ncbi:BTAD domain-containing putative transcriptional regulator [Plantactinospora sp. DSM 117369]
MHLQYSILGSLEVLQAGVPVELSGLRQRILLATLLLEAGNTVPVPRLVESVWDTSPPATAKEQVQNCLSALRRRFQMLGAGQNVIWSRPAGYALQLVDDDLDYIQFDAEIRRARRAAAEGQVVDATASLRAALALWRGAALDGLNTRVLRASAAQLDERRVAVLEECLDYELQLGRHHEVIGELSRLVIEYPLREGLHAKLMLALYRANRQADALDVYRRTHRTFVGELGLEPGNDLRRLHKAILAKDPSLDLRDPVVPVRSVLTERRPIQPQQLPPDAAVFVGRGRELDEIRAIAARRQAGQVSGACVLTGRIGIGKTALALHVAHRMQPQLPDGCLYADLSGSRPSSTDPNRVLGRFLGALGADLPSAYLDRLDLYRSLLAERRMVVILDDAADEAIVDPLVAAGGCVTLITSRAPITGLSVTQPIEVGPLAHDDAMTMLARLVGHGRVEQEPGAAEEILRLCDYVPLAIRVVGARLAAKPHWSIATQASRLADPIQRLNELCWRNDGVGARLSTLFELLDGTCRWMLRSLALLPRCRLSRQSCAKVADMSLAEADEVLEYLVDARMLQAELDPETGDTRYFLDELGYLFARDLVFVPDPPGRTPTGRNP